MLSSPPLLKYGEMLSVLSSFKIRSSHCARVWGRKSEKSFSDDMGGKDRSLMFEIRCHPERSRRAIIIDASTTLSMTTN